MSQLLKLAGWGSTGFGIFVLAFAMYALWAIPPGASWNFWTLGLLIAAGFVILSTGLSLVQDAMPIAFNERAGRRHILQDALDWICD
jgi:hypothetical protein